MPKYCLILAFILFKAYRKKKGGGQQKKTESTERGRSIETPLTNGNEDMPTGTGSKYQQKKAKKQAKKQAKVLRLSLSIKTRPFNLTTRPLDILRHAP